MLIGAEDLVPVDASAAAVVVDPGAYSRGSVTIDVAGIVCSVWFDRPETAAAFGRRYADLIVDGSEPERHGYAMEDPALGWLFWSAGGAAYRWPHGDLEPDVVAFLADAVALTAFFQKRADGVISLHAATLGVPGGVAAIMGDSNVGKTTTALACARRGMALFSDERCLIDRRSLVHAFPRALNVRARGLRLLAHDVVPGGDPIGTLLRERDGGDWSDVRISTLLPAQPRLAPERLAAVFLLCGTGRKPVVEEAPASRAALAAARWAQGAGTGLDKVERLMTVFSSARCYRLWLGTPDASARAIRAALEASLPRLRVPA